MEIIALTGQRFRLKTGPKRFKFLPKPDLNIKGQWSYNRDRLSDKPFTLIFNDDKSFALHHIKHLDCYALYPLEYIEYIPYLDIRNEWKYKKELKAWQAKNKPDTQAVW